VYTTGGAKFSPEGGVVLSAVYGLNCYKLNVSLVEPVADPIGNWDDRPP